MNRLARLRLVGRAVERDPVLAAGLHLATKRVGMSDQMLEGALQQLTPEQRTRAEAISEEWTPLQPLPPR